MSAVDASPEGSAAYWTKLLADPAFRAMTPEQRTAFLTKHVQEVQAQQQGQTAMQDRQLGQTVGAVAPARELVDKSPQTIEEAHPLDKALTDPNADHMAELQRYVYGP